MAIKKCKKASSRTKSILVPEPEPNSNPMSTNNIDSGPVAKHVPTRAPVILGVNFSLLFIASVIVILRITVKGKLGKLGIEDALIIIATLLTITLHVLTAFSVPYGFAMRSADIPAEWWPVYSKFSYTECSLASIPYPLIKISMIFFYLRLAQQPTFRKICYGTMGFMVLSAGPMFLLNLFSCIPVRAGWDHDPSLEAKCIDASPYFYFSYSMNVVTDILVLTLPIPILMRLQLRPKAKYGLIFMFTAGIFVTGISAFGVYTTYKAFHSPDRIWDGSYSWMWGLIEFNLGIITASMPSMLLFMKWVRGEMTEDKVRSESENPTIGGGGGKRIVAKLSHNKDKSQISTVTSHRLGSEEFIMQEAGGIAKSTELVVVDMGVVSAGRDGSMC